MGGCECASKLREEFAKLNNNVSSSTIDSIGSGLDVTRFAWRNSGSGAKATATTAAAAPISGSESNGSAPTTPRHSLHSMTAQGALQNERYTLPVIVACTGFDKIVVQRECEDSGIFKIEQKPISGARMRCIVSECVADLLRG